MTFVKTEIYTLHFIKKQAIFFGGSLINSQFLNNPLKHDTFLEKDSIQKEQQILLLLTLLTSALTEDIFISC